MFVTKMALSRRTVLRGIGATLALPIWLDYMQVALAKRPETERPEPEGMLRENDDWIYAEFAEMPQLRTIDVDVAALPAEPLPDDAEPDPEAEDHPRADSFFPPAAPPANPLFIPAQ